MGYIVKRQQITLAGGKKPVLHKELSKKHTTYFVNDAREKKKKNVSTTYSQLTFGTWLLHSNHLPAAPQLATAEKGKIMCLTSKLSFPTSWAATYKS